MNAEDRLRRFLRSAGPPPVVTEGDWSVFVQVAHRRRHRQRMAAVVAAGIVVVGAAGVWAVDRLTESTMPAGPVEPVILPDEVPRECPDAEPYEPASRYGTVAFVRDGDLYRADLEGGEVKLVETGNRNIEPDVGWSPDGRWIYFGEGVVVRAQDGEVCRPLGVVSDAQWGTGDTLVGIGAGRLLFGNPGGSRQEADLDGRFARSPLSIEGGRLIALLATVPGSGNNTIRAEEIWVFDVETGEATGGLRLAQNPATSPEIADLSPDGKWVFYWDRPRPWAPSDPSPLMAFHLGSTRDPVQVGTEPLFGDQLTWCGEQLIVNAPDKRLIRSGRRLAASTAPDWNVRPLSILAGDIYSDPLCSPDGGAVAAITFKVYPGRNATPRIHILGLGNTPGSDSQMQGGEYRNPSEWSSDGRWVMVELKRLGTGTISLSLQGLGGPTRFDTTRVNVIELGSEAEQLGPRTYDWYQP